MADGAWQGPSLAPPNHPTAQIVLRLFEAIKVNSHGPQLLHQKRIFPHFSFQILSSSSIRMLSQFSVSPLFSFLRNLAILPLCPYSHLLSSLISPPQYFPLYPLTDLPIVRPSYMLQIPRCKCKRFYRSSEGPLTKWGTINVRASKQTNMSREPSALHSPASMTPFFRTLSCPELPFFRLLSMCSGIKMFSCLPTFRPL